MGGRAWVAWTVTVPVRSAPLPGGWLWLIPDVSAAGSPGNGATGEGGAGEAAPAEVRSRPERGGRNAWEAFSGQSPSAQSRHGVGHLPAAPERVGGWFPAPPLAPDSWMPLRESVRGATHWPALASAGPMRLGAGVLPSLALRVPSHTTWHTHPAGKEKTAQGDPHPQPNPELHRLRDRCCRQRATQRPSPHCPPALSSPGPQLVLGLALNPQT